MLSKKKKEVVKEPEPSIEDLRHILKTSGWTVRELPIRNKEEVVKWRVIASNKDRDYTVEGNDLTKALRSLCRMLNLLK